MKLSKVLGSIMLLTVVAFGLFAFTSKGVHKAFATVCFKYDGPTAVGHPTADEATDPANWSTTTNPPSCGPTRVIICGICFNDDPTTGGYALVNGKPPFNDNATFKSRFLDHYTFTGQHGQTFDQITYYFRPRSL